MGHSGTAASASQAEGAVTGRVRGRAQRRRAATAAAFALALVGTAVAGITATGPATSAAVTTTNTLVALHSGNCIAVAEEAVTPGTELVQRRCLGADDLELFDLSTLADGSTRIAVRSTGRCVGIAGGSTAEGAAAVEVACADAESQQWDVEQGPSGNGIELVARHSGHCLTVAGASVADGAAVVQAACVDATNQRFRRANVGVDLTALSTTPIRQWGVVGAGLTVSTPKPTVWDFAEIGNRIYVAGTFTGVQRYGFDPNSQVITQSYLAAFDRDSGAWIPTFQPVINRTVYSLAVTPSGKLLVGGEFDQVNGQSRIGLVALDPTTGATDPTFPTTITRTNGRAMVRTMEIVGTSLYIGGEFANVVTTAGSPFVWNAARLDAEVGTYDAAWQPRYAGSVWDLAVDTGRGRVHAVGFFTSVNAATNTNRFASVTEAAGATIPGLPQLQFNTTSGQRDTVAVAFAGDRIWVGGAEHLVQILDGATNQRVAFNTTGISCDTFSFSGCSFTAGGDFQVFEVAGDTVLAGCHCFSARPGNEQWIGLTHYSSVTDTRTDNQFAIAYDAATGAPANGFVPGLGENSYGTWALHVDANGCLLVGGFYDRSAAGDWVGGFGRFCEPAPTVAGLETFSANRSVRLDWTAPAAQLPTALYKVFRDGTFIGDATGTTYTDTNRVAGATHTYTVRVQDVAGRLGPVASATATVAPADTSAPAPPATVTGVAQGPEVTLSWTAAVDDQGVREYLVHRNFQFVTVLPGTQTTFVDPAAPTGAVRYDVRARDWGGNLSEPATRTVTVGAPDTTPPSSPTNVTGVVANDADVTVTWTASTDPAAPGAVASGVGGYLVHRNFAFLAWVPAGTTYTDLAAPAGTNRYDIRAQDRAGNNSDPSPVVVAVGPPDVTPPLTPVNVAGTVDGASVTLTWDVATDPPGVGGGAVSGVAGYLVHRNFAFLAWVPAGTTYVDASAPAGTNRYEIRAQDRAGNNSPPSAPLNLQVNP